MSHLPLTARLSDLLALAQIDAEKLAESSRGWLSERKGEAAQWLETTRQGTWAMLHAKHVVAVAWLKARQEELSAGLQLRPAVTERDQSLTA